MFDHVVAAKALMALFNPRNKRVVFNHNKRCYEVQHSYEDKDVVAVYKGLTSWMPPLFWPKYNAQRASRLAKVLKGMKARKGATTKKVSGLRITTCTWDEYVERIKNRPDESERGLAAGLRAHKELENYGNLDPDTFRRVHPRLSGHGLGIIQALRQRKLVPLLSEHTIFDELCGYATRIDMVALDAVTKELVLVEFKTGNNRETFFGSSGSVLEGPFAKLLPNDSRASQACIQIMMAEITLRTLYNTRCRSMVLYSELGGKVEEVRVPRINKPYKALSLIVFHRQEKGLGVPLEKLNGTIANHRAIEKAPTDLVAAAFKR